jgi:hypothetical protein
MPDQERPYVLRYYGGPPGSPDRYVDTWPNPYPPSTCLHTVSCGTNRGYRKALLHYLTDAEAHLRFGDRCCGNCLRHGLPA